MVDNNSSIKEMEDAKLTESTHTLLVQVNQNKITNKEPLNLNTLKSFEYFPNDDGPFKVLIEIKEPTLTKFNINKINVAKTLKHLGLANQLLDIKKTGMSKVTAYFNNASSANDLTGNINLIEKNYTAYIPRHFISVTGIVSGIPNDISVEEIMQDINAGEIPIIEVYRLTRFINKKKELTNKIAVVFRTSFLPEFVKIMRVRCHVQPFFSRVLFCEKCLRYNHKSSNCKSSAIKCKKCCSVDHKEDDCNFRAFCFHCKENHLVNADNCKEREKQNHIKYIMAHNKLTYQEIMDEYDFFTKATDFNLFERSNEFPDIHESFKNKKNIVIPVAHTGNHSENLDLTDTNVFQFGSKNIKQVEKTLRKKKKKDKKSNLDDEESFKVNSDCTVERNKKRKIDHQEDEINIINEHRVSEFEALVSQMQVEKENFNLELSTEENSSTIQSTKNINILNLNNQDTVNSLFDTDNQY